MINKINIDVQIYIEKLMEGINQIGLIENLVTEWGIEDAKGHRKMAEGVIREMKFKVESK